MHTIGGFFIRWSTIRAVTNIETIALHNGITFAFASASEITCNESPHIRWVLNPSISPVMTMMVMMHTSLELQLLLFVLPYFDANVLHFRAHGNQHHALWHHLSKCYCWVERLLLFSFKNLRTVNNSNKPEVRSLTAGTARSRWWVLCFVLEASLEHVRSSA